ncbi:MAG: CpaF family protein, partial [Acidimicrobiia bacterium]
MRTLEAEVRRLVEQSGLDPQEGDRGQLDALIEDALTNHSARTAMGAAPSRGDLDTLKRTLLARVAGFGPLQSLMDDPEVEEIWLNGPGRVFYAANGRHNLTNIVLDETEIGPLVERMLRASGRRIDLSNPFVDATLPDGSRLHVAIPDITRRHWAVNIRKYILRANRLDELVRLRSMSARVAKFLDASVVAGFNIVVSGGTQTGKTTLLNCLAAAIPPQERVITCEEVFELDVRLPDVVAMQTRAPNLEGKGAIDLRRLIVEALRMRPDRIIVGEVRQQEAFDLLVALNSGLPGLTSIHANSAVE